MISFSFNQFLTLNLSNLTRKLSTNMQNLFTELTDLSRRNNELWLQKILTWSSYEILTTNWKSTNASTNNQRQNFAALMLRMIHFAVFIIIFHFFFYFYYIWDLRYVDIIIQSPFLAESTDIIPLCDIVKHKRRQSMCAV
jgi:hypothetical protein